MLVVINLLMAFACIGIFMRMTPAITIIIEQNERSLRRCTGRDLSQDMREVFNGINEILDQFHT